LAQEVLPVTVVIPLYNRERLIGETLDSVFGQRGCAPGEVVVVDDGSTDSSADVAAQHSGPVRVVRQANQGEGGARNTGLKEAVHEWVAFLDSDDLWFPTHLSTLWAAREGHVLISTTATGSRSGSIRGNPLKKARSLCSPRDALWPDNVIVPSATLVRKSELLALGGFRPLSLAADLDMWLRLLERGTGLALPDVTVTYREHTGQVSLDQGAMRAAMRQLLVDYSDRAWLDAQTQRSVLVRLAWDAWRASEHDGANREWSSLLRSIRAPATAAALAQVLVWRRQARIKSQQARLGVP
jgi:glycosyltransferase involved in cell wall biosynthesis